MPESGRAGWSRVVVSLVVGLALVIGNPVPATGAVRLQRAGLLRACCRSAAV
jgi:hypothetical protein